MVLQGSLSVFAVGCAGGVLGEILHWWNLRQKPEWPEYAKHLKYWVATLLMTLAGGLVCWLYFGQRVAGPIGLHVGITTPLLLQKLLGSIPRQVGGRHLIVQPRATLANFFRW